jgi:hypothetical protein
MTVGVDEGGNDGLATEIDDRRVWRDADGTVPRAPTAVKRPASTTNAESVIAGVVSPVMSRAPSKTTGSG